MSAASAFDPVIADAAAKAGVPVALLKSIGVVESGMNPATGASRVAAAVTDGGPARGMMQMKDGTAASMGVDANDPTSAIYGAAKYLRQGYDATGSWDDAARYYHGGPNRKLWGPKTEAYHGKIVSTAQTLVGPDGGDVAPAAPTAPAGGINNPFLAMAGLGAAGVAAGAAAPVAAQPQQSGGQGPVHNPFLAMAGGDNSSPHGVVDPSAGMGGAGGGDQSNAAFRGRLVQNGQVGPPAGAGGLLAGLADPITNAVVNGVPIGDSFRDNLAGWASGAAAIPETMMKAAGGVSRFAGNAHLADTLDRWSDNLQHTVEGFAADKNSTMFKGRQLAGEVASTLPFGELAPFGDTADAKGLVAALRRYGNLAAQGAAGGAAVSRGDNVMANAAAGGVGGAAVGAVIDRAVPLVSRAYEGAGSKLAAALRKAVPGADASVPAGTASIETAADGSRTFLDARGRAISGERADGTPKIVVDITPETPRQKIAMGNPALAQQVRDAVPSTGPFGPVHHDLAGDWQGAVARLSADQTGEVPGAIAHPEVGPIAVPWGAAPSPTSDGYGLAKIAAKHPEVVADLPNIVQGLPVKSSSDNRIVLEDATHRAVVSRNWQGSARDPWVVTAFEKAGTPTAEASAPGVQTSHRGPPTAPDGASTGTGASPDIAPPPTSAKDLAAALRATVQPNPTTQMAASGDRAGLADALRQAAGGDAPPIAASDLGSRGARRGIEANTNLPDDVAQHAAALMRDGPPRDQAIREAEISSVGAQPTLASLTRNPADQRGMWEGAKQDTPEGQALATQIANNNGALHGTMQDMIKGLGGVPAAGETSEAAARALADHSDAMMRSVQERYAEAAATDGDARADPSDIYAVVTDPLKNAAVNPKAGSFLRGMKQRLDLLTHNGKIGLAPHALEHLRQGANDAYDEVGSGEVRKRIEDVTNEIDAAFRKLGDAGPTYAKARAAYEQWAKLYKDPEGVEALVRRDAHGNFLNEGNWRKAENGFVGGTADRPFVQIVRQLHALPENAGAPAIERLKASVMQRAYEAATGARGGNALDMHGNSLFSGKLFLDHLNKIGMPKLQALFDPGELGRLATIGRAASHLNEAVPGTVNTSGTASALLNALGSARDAGKQSGAHKLMRLAGHVIGGATHPGIANVAVEGISHAAGAVKVKAANAAVVEQLKRMGDPAYARAQVTAEMKETADQLRRSVTARAIANRTAPVTGSVQEGKR